MIFFKSLVGGGGFALLCFVSNEGLYCQRWSQSTSMDSQSQGFPNPRWLLECRTPRSHSSQLESRGASYRVKLFPPKAYGHVQPPPQWTDP